jgi:hypothetical protein
MGTEERCDISLQVDCQGGCSDDTKQKRWDVGPGPEEHLRSNEETLGRKEAKSFLARLVPYLRFAAAAPDLGGELVAQLAGAPALRGRRDEDLLPVALTEGNYLGHSSNRVPVQIQNLSVAGFPDVQAIEALRKESQAKLLA